MKKLPTKTTMNRALTLLGKIKFVLLPLLFVLPIGIFFCVSISPELFDSFNPNIRRISKLYFVTVYIVFLSNVNGRLLLLATFILGLVILIHQDKKRKGLHVVPCNLISLSFLMFFWGNYADLFFAGTLPIFVELGYLFGVMSVVMGTLVFFSKKILSCNKLLGSTFFALGLLALVFQKITSTTLPH